MDFRRPIIRYLHDCYREENARAVLWNLQGSSVEHQIFLEGREELLDGFLEETPVPFDRAGPAAKAAALHRKEKQLLYAAFPIIGRIALADGKSRALFSPLMTFPATIQTEGEYAILRIELEGRRINAGLLDALQSDEGETPLADLLEAALEEWTISEAKVSSLAGILTANIRDLDASTVWEYPVLTDPRTLLAAARKATVGAGFRIFPAACVCLVNRPVEARGVLGELTEIAEGKNLSPPLRALLHGCEPTPLTPDTSPDAIPAILSDSQTRILHRARTEPLSLVIGPPGTGKSYTIAAIALDHFNRGESVLIGSKMNHAVDVIANKIEGQLGASGKVVRAGRRHYLRDLKTYIDDLLDGPTGDLAEIKAALGSLGNTIGSTEREISHLGEAISKSGVRHLKWGETLAALEQGSRSIFKYLAGKWIRRRQRADTPLWELVARYLKLLEQRSFLVAGQVRHQQDFRTWTGLSAHRPALKTFRAALGARIGTEQDELFEKIDLETFLRLLPIWLVSLSDAHRVLPHRNELFDLVIIDEATQCDIAGCLPFLQRAKRAVIVGDPKQLRHLSFLARNRQQEFASKHGLSAEETDLFDFRHRSILDLCSERIEAQGSVNFLNEHFRSAPQIIRFSNQTFYANRLHVMTERPGGALASAALSVALSVAHSPSAGQRGASGVNAIEANDLLNALAIQAGASADTPERRPLSIGILSPFRSQVDHLATRIAETFDGSFIDRHQLLLGTAHTFQGEERDLMFLSFAIDADAPAASRRFLERPDLFNVAITRARLQQTVFSSIQPEALPADSLLRRYLSSLAPGVPAPEPGSHPELAQLDRFASEVKRHLEERGFAAWIGYPVAGLRIDLLACKAGRSLAIDLIGCPGPTAHVFPLERYRMFLRASLTLWPLPYTNWVFDREACLDAIEKAIIDENSIA